MTTTCPTCGRHNAIVNQCRCDPNNLPTRPEPHTVLRVAFGNLLTQAQKLLYDLDNQGHLQQMSDAEVQAVELVREFVENAACDLEDMEMERHEDRNACPGCGCLPGDGITEGCEHPDGCGYLLDEEEQEQLLRDAHGPDAPPPGAPRHY